MVSARTIRTIFALLLLVSVGLVGSEYVFAQRDTLEERSSLQGSPSESVVLIETNSSYKPNNLTVVTSVAGAISSAQERGALFVVTPNGTVVHQESRYNIYDDVDPIHTAGTAFHTLLRKY
ncbi:hypothetical protein ACFQFH_15045 [Halobaculum halobium]